jgi:hypothetical protein
MNNTLGWGLHTCGLKELIPNTYFGGVCLLHTASFVGAYSSNQIVSIFAIHSCNKKH